MTFKICAVGCGNMAASAHGPSYKKYMSTHEGVELTACCDLDESRSAAYGREFGFLRHYTDMELMLDTEKPDAVCLVAPVHLTSRLSCEIFEKGYPLLLEKPPGLNPAETLAMIHAADKKKTPNQVAFNRRFMPLVTQLKALLAKVEGIDRIINIHYQMLRVGRLDLDFATTAIHGIDLVKYIAASDYSMVHFRYQELGHIGRNIANIHMDCEFAPGTYAQLDFFPVSGADVERIEINTYNHTIYLNLPSGMLDGSGKLTHIEGEIIKYECSGRMKPEYEEMYIRNGFYHENESFFEDIRNGRYPECDIKSGLQSVEIADCIRNRTPEYKPLSR